MIKEEISLEAAATGKIPSGLFIVTASVGNRMEGYLASWIQQVSFSPLLISVTIKEGRPCYDLIKSSGRFCVNIVGHNNGGLMKPFWTPNPEVSPFAILPYSRSDKGNVILTNAMAALECEVRQSLQPGDHEMLIAEVVAGHVLQHEDKPLHHVRKSGLTY